jgi:hypothetical protein
VLLLLLSATASTSSRPARRLEEACARLAVVVQPVLVPVLRSLEHPSVGPSPAECRRAALQHRCSRTCRASLGRGVKVKKEGRGEGVSGKKDVWDGRSRSVVSRFEMDSPSPVSVCLPGLFSAGFSFTNGSCRCSRAGRSGFQDSPTRSMYVQCHARDGTGLDSTKHLKAKSCNVTNLFSVFGGEKRLKETWCLVPN